MRKSVANKKKTEIFYLCSRNTGLFVCVYSFMSFPIYFSPDIRILDTIQRDEGGDFEQLGEY